MTEYYKIFDTTFSCDFALPEMLLPTHEGAEFHVTLADGDSIDEHGFETAFNWFNYDGKRVCSCERRADEYLFVFPGYASFHAAAGLITCCQEAGGDISMLRHLLLNQIIPRYLASNGRLVLHASAVTLTSGSTVAFLGNTGFGKSTLASSFHRHGAHLIDDDCIMLKPADDGVIVMGGFPGIRLYPDSVHAVFTETKGFSAYTPYSDKQQLLLGIDAAGKPARPQRLDGVFLLDDPNNDQPANALEVEPVSGSRAMMALVYCTFSLDPTDQQLIVQNFQHIGAAITERLGLYSLSYPRDHGQLAAVREAVELVVP